MAPKKITVEGAGVKLSNDNEFYFWLSKKQVESLVDSDGDEVVGFESLEDGGTYTLGPPQQQQGMTSQPQQQRQDGEGQHGLKQYAYEPDVKKNDKFEHDGFGPFIVERAELRRKILMEAGPRSSVHISGTKGSGKTSLLKLLGNDLVNQGKTVYYLVAASALNATWFEGAIRDLIAKKTEAYFLVDESQTVASSEPAALIHLLKNSAGHNLTIVGAGVPEYATLSARFSVSHKTWELFLSDDELETEGIVSYFGGTGKEKAILRHIRSHSGGHLYPLMRGMELMLQLPQYHQMSAADVTRFYESNEFRRGSDYEQICRRVLPSIKYKDVFPLFSSHPNEEKLEMLVKCGFIYPDKKVVSRLLLDAFMDSLQGDARGTESVKELKPGLEGIKEILRFCLPNLKWDQYDVHGGPTEDSITFELLSAMAHVQGLSTRLFNPKLVDVGTAARRPDVYLNAQINSYIECLINDGDHSGTEKKNLNEHIERFCAPDDPNADVHYQLRDGQDFAILQYQRRGRVPVNPDDAYSHLFDERVFTFLMATKEVYLGNIKLV